MHSHNSHIEDKIDNGIQMFIGIIQQTNNTNINIKYLLLNVLKSIIHEQFRLMMPNRVKLQ